MDITRQQILSTWSQRDLELRAQHEDCTHLVRFLRRLQSVPGTTLDDISHHWHRRQEGQRQTWSCLLVLLVALSGLLACLRGSPELAVTGCSILSLLGSLLIHLGHRQDEAFLRELETRARWS